MLCYVSNHLSKTTVSPEQRSHCRLAKMDWDVSSGATKTARVCFVRGGKSMWDVLSGVSKNGMGCFVRVHDNSSKDFVKYDN